MHGHSSWSGSLVRAGAAVAALAALLAPAATPAAAQSVADAVEACDPLTEVPEVGPRVCGALERGTWLTAQHCRRVPPAQEPVCPSIDGRPVHESAMQAYEASWVARALDLQRELDLDVPLTESLTLHTHNSGNSTAYDPSLTTTDANQVLSVTDQLRLGIRGIELDLHWVPNPAGDPAQGFRTVVQCHGQSIGTPLGSVGVGCSVDRTFDAHLAELAAWFERPEAAGELVVLYLENQLDQDEVAHASAVEALERHLGPLLYRPVAGGRCQDLPVTRAKREILATGAQILLTGNCGPSGWNDLVFQRGDAWDESGSSTDYLAGSTCDDERAAGDYANSFIRRWEDSTFLSLMANGGSHISPEVAAAMVRCGVNFPGFDQVHPDDERLPALVWSWRADAEADDPTAGCAAQGDDGRFGALPCETVLPVACRTGVTEDPWAVSSRAVAWADADLACQADAFPGAGVPANGWGNELLRRASEGTGDVWLAYGRAVQPDGSERWSVGVPVQDPDTGGDDGRPGNRPTHPGRPTEPGRPDHAGPPADAGETSGVVTGVAMDRTGFAGRSGAARLPLMVGALLLVGVAGAGTRRRRARRA